MKFLIILVSVVLLSGGVNLFFSMLDGSQLTDQTLIFLTVSSIYLLGAFALHSMYTSPNHPKPWLSLTIAFLALLIAYFTLETLFLNMYGRQY